MQHYDDDYPHIVGPITDFDQIDLPDMKPGLEIEGPLIPLRDMVIFPQMVAPLFIGRPRSLDALLQAEQDDNLLICITQIDPDEERPSDDDLYQIGVVVAVGRTLRLPDGSTSALVQGRRRVELIEITQTEPSYRVRVRVLPEANEKTNQTTALMRSVLGLYEEVVALNRAIPEDAFVYAMNVEDPGWLADLVASTLDISVSKRQALLAMESADDRLMQVSLLLGQELVVLEMEEEISARVQDEIDKVQREMFLRERMRVIQSELGELDVFQQEIIDIQAKIEESDLPDDVRDKARKEAARLLAMPSMSPEVGVIRTYLDWMLELPWTNASEDRLDLTAVADTLDANHYGLDKAKDRIVEFLAVRKLAADRMKSPILCFAGPPGTGKTSLGKSIATAMGREFVRVSLGGVRDEAEIRGHRRTYIGAMPGRIIQTMRRAGTINPVFMLDEIDKLGQDYRGDPSAALLEVLDPEQNHSFSDHYLEADYDLSKVFFITTANYTGGIPSALLDRMELIEFPGYVEEEKLAIARQFIIPRTLPQHGLEDAGLQFRDDALRHIIRDYTYEAGVRNFEREIERVLRKTARKVAEGKKHRKRITTEVLTDYLGPPQISPPPIPDKAEIGVGLGLAWTEGGGDVMPVEVSIMPGKGNLTLTGQLGDVMQESAQAALSFIRGSDWRPDLPLDMFDNIDIHIHLPEGGIPKDGPSAGITLATALVSVLTRRPVRHDIAMTGEITLHGRVLPIGGIREKLLAAHRIGIKTTVIPKGNEKDLVDIPAKILKTLTVNLVEHIDEVLELALMEATAKPEDVYSYLVDSDTDE